jgi:hypothetical protein
MANLHPNLRLVSVNSSVQVIPIYKAKTYKNMYNTLCKISTKYS